MNLNSITEYELISKQNIADINSEGYILKHKKTGARLVCLSNDDANKVFYIGFKTPPTDSTGVPHIIEHSVLCGSKKYPAKDPFVELAKGSLNTFLNAMTYPDKTVYPVASCNDQDFKNLVDVYLDAVFHPNIYSRQEIFKQEGWHYELENTDEDISLNGVVYSEMKGAFSSPDDVLEREIMNSLFPDTCYGVESGGDPDVIPSLTYEDFLAFHSKYYHPSNSYIYLYGDMDMEAYLKYLDEEYLSKYDYLEVDSAIKKQEAFGAPSDSVKEYSITNDESTEDNTYISYSTVIGNALDKELYIAFQIIDYALIGSPGAPLKKALLESGICKDVYGGYDNGIYQPYFSIIIKNSNQDKKAEFIKIIQDVLKDVIENGFDKKSLRAGINLFEFKFREADFGQYPKGLMYGLDSLDSWLYDDKEPFMHIQPLETYEFLKKMVDTNYFEELVDKYLVNNKHEAIVTMIPKAGLTADNDKKLADKLAELKSKMTKEELEALVKETKHLHDYQQEEDDAETLALIPCLHISDIKKEAEGFVYTENKVEDITVLTHDVFTNGIGYLATVFDLTDLPLNMVPYVGLFKAVFGLLNTKNYTYADLANEIFLNSGGISTGGAVTIDRLDSDKYTYTFKVKGKILYDKLDFAFKMIEEMAFTSDFDDKKRLYEIICMLKSRVQASMMGQGHSVSAKRALANISKPDAITDAESGIRFYRFVEEIESDFEAKADDVIANLKKIRDIIFSKERLLLVDYTATKDQDEAIFDQAIAFSKHLTKAPEMEAVNEWAKEYKNEAFKTGAKVQYVSLAGRYIDEEHPYTGALSVLKTIMGYDYLWNQVRVVGGAYGAFARFFMAGEGYFSSYRDPNLKRTLEVYEKASEYLKNFDANERDMTKYIIGTISEIDIPKTPSQIGEYGLASYINHNSYDFIQKNRDEVLNCSKEDIRKLSEYIENVFKNYSICVIGGEEMIENEKDLFDNIEPLFMN